MGNLPRSEYANTLPAFDGGIKILTFKQPVFFRVYNDIVYRIEPDGLITAKPVKDVLALPDPILYGDETLSGRGRWPFADAVSAAGKTLCWVRIFIGYRKVADGTVAPFRNDILARLLITQLQPGDHVSRLHELAKTTFLGQQTDAARERVREMGLSQEFIANVKLTPSLDTVGAPYPLFRLTFFGTSRVDVDFCRRHRKDFIRQSLEKIHTSGLYKTMGLPDTAFSLDDYTLASDHSIQLVFGLKKELIRALEGVTLPSGSKRATVIGKACAGHLRSKPDKPESPNPS